MLYYWVLVGKYKVIKYQVLSKDLIIKLEMRQAEVKEHP